MKRISKFACAIVITTLIAGVGCKKSEQGNGAESAVTDQIDKVETSYTGGIKSVTFWSPGCDKVETSAPESYIQRIFEESPESKTIIPFDKAITGDEACVLQYTACTDRTYDWFHSNGL
jgi:hypothetical protein